jgi:hypothetical protein
MVSGRFHLGGLLAVLLALMAQLGAGASVPRIDPVTGVGVLCHTNAGGGGPAHGPSRSSDCLVCPLCVALHAPSVTLIPADSIPVPPGAGAGARAELPPPPTAPPAQHRPPAQPRAPPIFS